MGYAIVEIGGHQYKVAEKDVLFVDKQTAEDNKLTFDKVLLVKEDSGVKIGTPVVEGAEVSATILDTVKADKVLVQKEKKKRIPENERSSSGYVTDPDRRHYFR